MMVNEMNKNSVPWPNTIPDQMPWFDQSACPPETPMQFLGHQPYNPIQISPEPPNPLIHLENPAPGMMINNPFYPQQSSGIQSFQCAQTETLTKIDTHASSASNFGTSLTHMPNLPLQTSQAINHKRSSFEMEDDLTTKEAPPTKQQLSESNLFQRFGSLHLDTEPGPPKAVCSVECEDEEDCETITSTNQSSDRKEFDRYVYLLFKDKESGGQLPIAASNAIERLLREEREKLSKAVILWNPPPRTSFFENEDDSGDEELDYKDHRDFLKSTIEISEVEDDINMESNSANADDIMQE